MTRDHAAKLAIEQALFLHARSLLPREVPHEVAGAYAERFFAWLSPRSTRTGWDEAEHASLERVHTKECLGRVLRLPARVSAESKPILMPLPARLAPGTRDEHAYPKIDARRWTIGEPDETTIESLPIPEPTRFSSLRDPESRDRPHELLVLSVALPTSLSHDPSAKIDDDARSFAVIVLDARPVTSALALIAASPNESAAAEATLNKLRKQKLAPWRWIAREVKRRFDVVGEGMDDAIELCVLQALSHGMVGLDSARLHLLFVSPPGQGKGLLLAIARALSPRSVLVSPNDVTVAGLRGASRATPTGWTQRPGLYARSDRGVLAFPDAHSVTQRKVAPIMSSLHGVMDRGVVGTGTTGTREARTLAAICMDANRREDVGQRGAGRPTHLPLPELASILSRMDAVIVLAGDEALPWKTSEAILERLEASEGGARGDAMRDLRVLVASLVDRHPIVDLGKRRAALIAPQKKFMEHVLARTDVFADHAFLANRIAVSRAKTAMALARGRDRDVVGADDIDESTRLAWQKIHSIEAMRRRAIAADEKPKAGKKPSTTEARLAWYARSFEAQEATRRQILARYEKDHGARLSTTTLTRDLEALGARTTSYGRYRFPSHLPT